jgi:hypothetical protein
MDTSRELESEIQKLERQYSQKHAKDYIRGKYPNLLPELSYIPPIHCPDQLWKRVEESGSTYWIFFSISITEQSHTHNSLQDRAFLLYVLEEMLLSDHLQNQKLSLQLSEALEIGHLIVYRLHICFDQDVNLLSISQTEIDLNLLQPIESQSASDSKAQPTLLPELAQNPEPSPPTISLTPQQKLYALQHLANQRHFIEEQLQTWLKQYGQPSEGTIAHHLQNRITQQSKTLYHHLLHLAESCLNSLTALDLQTELERSTTQQQQEKDLLDVLEQNPILGYLDAKLLECKDTLLQSVNPFTDHQEGTFYAKSLRRKGKEPRNSLILNPIAACQSETYQAYRQRYPSLSAIHLAIRYTLNQKLYPNRQVSIGPATRDAYPRLELLWSGMEKTTPSDSPFTQIWRSFPLLRLHPPQWLVITATSETQKLKMLTLEDGQIAQEGTKEYLMRSLQMMIDSSDEYTRDLGTLVSEALEQGCMKWMHLHQTKDLETGEPRDIVQLQFQLSESD